MTVDELENFFDDNPIEAWALQGLPLKDQLKIAPALKEGLDAANRRVQFEILKLKARRRRRGAWYAMIERNERRRKRLADEERAHRLKNIRMP